MRLLSAEAKVPLNHIRNGQMSDDDWTKLARKMGEVSSAPMFIDDSPNMTMMEIRAKARRLKQRHDLRLIVIDYMQLMTSGKKVESRQLEVSEFSRQIKLLAKELEVPIIALSQLNRGPEQRSDKRPMMSDLRESGSLEQDADMVILLHREDLYERESDPPRRGRPDRRQAPQRPHPRHHRGLPGPLLALRRHGALSRGPPFHRHPGECPSHSRRDVGRWAQVDGQPFTWEVAMTTAVSRFEPTIAPCGHPRPGERIVTEDQQGLVTEDLRYACGCRAPRRSSTTAASTSWSCTTTARCWWTRSCGVSDGADRSPPTTC